MVDPVTKPINYVKLRAFMSACGISRLDGGAKDDHVAMRLIRLLRSASRLSGVPFRAAILAFDRTYTRDGEVDERATTLHVPNDYVLRLARRYGDVVVPTCSVHPYRRDAVEELRRCARNGATIVKWLPNSMHFDPLEVPPEYYAALRELDLTLLSHTGEEHSVAPPEPHQEWGNPLRLRAALDAGVRVIAAHCATEGHATDLDAPPNARGRRPSATAFSLWRRLMDETRYEGLLFADISAICAFRRVGFLPALLRDCEPVHHRLVYGSDYPVPCISFVVRESPQRAQQRNVGARAHTPRARRRNEPAGAEGPHHGLAAREPQRAVCREPVAVRLCAEAVPAHARGRCVPRRRLPHARRHWPGARRGGGGR